MDQAGLPDRFEGELAERTGVILGTGLGGVGTLIDGITTNALRGPDRISPFLIPMGIPNIGAGQIAISFGMTGPELHDGVGLRDRRPRDRRGERDRSAAATPTSMIAGGAEAGVYEPIVGGFAAMRALSTPQRRPGGRLAAVRQGPRRLRHRARAAGVVVLEELEHAEARGATILAELVGYGATADASHITLPAPGGIGAVRAARRALEKAGLDAGRDRPRQRPCDVDAGGRQGRAPGDPDDLRRPTPAGSRSPPTSRCSATRSARPARSRRSSRS